MRDIDLFQLALGLSSPWIVESAEFDATARTLDIHLNFPRGSRFCCGECGAADCPVHDCNEQKWRHLDFFQHKAFLHARVPRVTCPHCGVRKVATPWARPGSGFTLLFEAVVLSMAKTSPVNCVARQMGESDTRLWRILNHYVDKAVDETDLSEVTQIAVDETSARRGHDYVTLFADCASRKVIYVADGRDAATLKAFAAWLEAHGGACRAITDASIDMSAAFISGVGAHLPQARITFDWFHVMKLVNEAVDEVRRQESRSDPKLKGTRYLWLKNVGNLSEAQRQALAALEGSNLETAQAWQMRVNLQKIRQLTCVKQAGKFLDRWLNWVRICDLKPMLKVAATIRSKADDILRSLESGLSNGFMEALNANVQAAKRMAKGYRTRRNLKTIIYLRTGKAFAPFTHSI